MKFIIDHTDSSGKQLKTAPPIDQHKKDGTHCFYNIVNPSNKIQCDECKRDISKNTKILAEDCDFCVTCFANVDQTPQEYHVINKLDYPLFDYDWTADEELMLFEGLEKHGFGNWAEIADFMGSSKTKEDVEQHYINFFLESPEWIPTATVITQRDEEGQLIRLGCENPSKKFSKPISRIFSTHSVQSFQRGSLTVNQMPGTKTGNNPAEIVGYMPKRGDFEVQFDNDAELLLAQMEFNDDDSEEEIKMKFRLLDLYNIKLTERIKRKEFVISRKLLDLKEQVRLDKARTKEEKEIYSLMKVFARFSAPEEHEQLVQGIIKEKQIRSKIQQLEENKKIGFTTLSALQEEIEGKRKKEEKLKKDPIFYPSERGKSTVPPEMRMKKSKKESNIDKLEVRPVFPTPEEQQLCDEFCLSPLQLLTIKQTLIRESIKQGIIELDSASRMFKVGRQVVERVVDFLVKKEELLGQVSKA